jgi:hypothetical protein
MSAMLKYAGVLCGVLFAVTPSADAARDRLPKMQGKGGFSLTWQELRGKCAAPSKHLY